MHFTEETNVFDWSTTIQHDVVSQWEGNEVNVPRTGESSEK